MAQTELDLAAHQAVMHSEGIRSFRKQTVNHVKEMVGRLGSMSTAIKRCQPCTVAGIAKSPSSTGKHASADDGMGRSHATSRFVKDLLQGRNHQTDSSSVS